MTNPPYPPVVNNSSYGAYPRVAIGVGANENYTLDLWTAKKMMEGLINQIKAYVAKHPGATPDNDENMAYFKKRSEEINLRAPHDAFGEALKSAIVDTVGAIQKIPVLGPIITAAAAPLSMTVSLSHGERIDHALLDAAKTQLGAIKAVAPYAATIISLFPGIGTGIAAALSFAAALAEGKPIDQALEDAVKSALPGGALAVSGFELAKKVASGENVAQSVLESARAALPSDVQKGFDLGLAIVQGKKLQNALTSAIVSLAPGELKQLIDVGAKAVQSVPGLAQLAKSLPTDVARQGLQLASGALAHAGVNEAQMRAMRSKLTGDVLKGFDAALKAQAPHFPWAESVISQPATPIVQGPTQAQLDLQKLAQLSPAEQKQLVDLQALSKLTPEQQKQLVDLQSLSKLTPEQQKQLVDYAKAKNAPPKPHELPAKKPAAPAPPKPHEPTPKAITRAAPAGSPAPPPLYGPYPSAVPGGSLHGVPAGYGAYPGALSAPPHLPHHPHASHGRLSPAPWRHHGVPFVPGASVSTDETCRVWGNAIALPPAMDRAARAALGASGGNPTMVRGPDGVLYLFAFENGQLAARPCASIA